MRSASWASCRPRSRPIPRIGSRATIWRLALYASGEQEKALDELLEIVQRNRPWNEEAARKQLVKFFEALGPAHPLTLSGRRRLSSLLFR